VTAPAPPRDRLRTHDPGLPDDVLDLVCALACRPTAELVDLAEFTLPKPYGANHVLRSGGEHGLSFACFRPGQGSSLHYHRTRREVFYVRTGMLTLRTGDTWRHLDAGGCGISTPGVPHALRNDGAGPLEVLEVFTPALLDDKVRVEDSYARALGPVGRHQ